MRWSRVRVPPLYRTCQDTSLQRTDPNLFDDIISQELEAAPTETSVAIRQEPLDQPQQRDLKFLRRSVQGYPAEDPTHCRGCCACVCRAVKQMACSGTRIGAANSGMAAIALSISRSVVLSFSRLEDIHNAFIVRLRRVAPLQSKSRSRAGNHVPSVRQSVTRQHTGPQRGCRNEFFFSEGPALKVASRKLSVARGQLM